jgi:hypothetical protein
MYNWIVKQEFSEWLTRKYIDWRGDAIGQDKSITEFAAMLGVSTSLMSQWMKKNGKIPTNSKNISALVEKFGYEVYTILGMPGPSEPNYDAVSISSLPPDLQDRFRKAMAEIDSALVDRKVLSDSEEGRKVIRESFGKYGLNVTINE